MNLITIDEDDEKDLRFLFNMLKERTKKESISHKKMPTYKEHKKFVKSEPYKMWSLILDDSDNYIGTCYLSKQNEIGIFLLKRYRRKGIGSMLIEYLIEVLKEKEYYANINPKNVKSVEFFKRLGFKHIQNTYRLTL